MVYGVYLGGCFPCSGKLPTLCDPFKALHSLHTWASQAFASPQQVLRKNKRRASLLWLKASEPQSTALASPNSKPVRGQTSLQRECVAGTTGLMEGRKQRPGLETRDTFLCLAVSSNRVHLSKVPITSQNIIKSCHPRGPN